MLSGRSTQAALRVLDFISTHLLPQSKLAPHTRTGRRGEEDAYFHLRRLGYIMVARNFRSPRQHGEIDLIAWDEDVLCFIEVKTRTSHDIKPAETAVDRRKWKRLKATAREYMRHLPNDLQWRFDVITVYYDRHSGQPQFQLFRNALPSS